MVHKNVGKNVRLPICWYECHCEIIIRASNIWRAVGENNVSRKHHHGMDVERAFCIDIALCSANGETHTHTHNHVIFSCTHKTSNALVICARLRTVYLPF